METNNGSELYAVAELGEQLFQFASSSLSSNPTAWLRNKPKNTNNRDKNGTQRLSRQVDRTDQDLIGLGMNISIREALQYPEMEQSRSPLQKTTLENNDFISFQLSHPEGDSIYSIQPSDINILLEKNLNVSLSDSTSADLYKIDISPQSLGRAKIYNISASKSGDTEFDSNISGSKTPLHLISNKIINRRLSRQLKISIYSLLKLGIDLESVTSLYKYLDNISINKINLFLNNLILMEIHLQRDTLSRTELRRKKPKSGRIMFLHKTSNTENTFIAEDTIIRLFCAQEYLRASQKEIFTIKKNCRIISFLRKRFLRYISNSIKNRNLLYHDIANCLGKLCDGRLMLFVHPSGVKIAHSEISNIFCSHRTDEQSFHDPDWKYILIQKLDHQLLNNNNTLNLSSTLNILLENKVVNKFLLFEHECSHKLIGHVNCLCYWNFPNMKKRDDKIMMCLVNNCYFASSFSRNHMKSFPTVYQTMTRRNKLTDALRRQANCADGNNPSTNKSQNYANDNHNTTQSSPHRNLCFCGCCFVHFVRNNLKVKFSLFNSFYLNNTAGETSKGITHIWRNGSTLHPQFLTLRSSHDRFTPKSEKCACLKIFNDKQFSNIKKYIIIKLVRIFERINEIFLGRYITFIPCHDMECDCLENKRFVSYLRKIIKSFLTKVSSTTVPRISSIPTSSLSNKFSNDSIYSIRGKEIRNITYTKHHNKWKQTGIFAHNKSRPEWENSSSILDSGIIARRNEISMWKVRRGRRSGRVEERENILVRCSPNQKFRLHITR